MPGGGAGVYFSSGEFFTRAIDLEIPGRGFNWKFEHKYRSGVEYDGPWGHNWFLIYSQHLVVVTEDNQGQVYPGFGTVAPGDVLDPCGSRYHNGNFYSPLDASLVNWSVVPETAAFDGAPASGYITEFTVVPEPATLALLAFGGLALLNRRRMRFVRA